MVPPWLRRSQSCTVALWVGLGYCVDCYVERFHGGAAGTPNVPAQHLCYLRYGSNVVADAHLPQYCWSAVARAVDNVVPDGGATRVLALVRGTYIIVGFRSHDGW